MVTINPANHYNLNSGSINIGKKANFTLIDNFKDFNIKKTIVEGKLVASDKESFLETKKSTLKDTFILDEKTEDDFNIAIDTDNDSSNINVKVIEVTGDEIITNEYDTLLTVENGIIQENVNEDILKLAVVERYGGNAISNAFIKGFNLKKGAIASSIAHDSHNIIVLGTNSKDMARTVNLIRENQGGVVFVSQNIEKILKLPIAGLMSDKDIFTVTNEINEINNLVKNLGCNFEAPFMTLSFMALLLIPKLRLSDKSLFDVNKFSFVNLINEF